MSGRRAGKSEPPLFDRATKWWLLVAGVMAVGGVIAWLRTREKWADEYIGPVNVVSMVQGFRRDIEAVANDPNADEAVIQAAIDRIDHEPEKWKEPERSTFADITAARSRLVGKLDLIRKEVR